MLRTLAVVLVAVVSALFPSPPQAEEGAAATVTAFHQSLLQAMRQGTTIGCTGRAQQLAPAIDAAFDLPDLSRRALRRQWPTLDAGQRSQFVASFRELVIATYASRFKTYAGERFDTLDTLPQPDGLQLVHAKLQPLGDDAVSFDYVLHLVDGRWKIVNIIADGVSDLALRSAQYDKLFKQQGFDGLLAELAKQTRAARACK
jgi:phospholipid transport system substrate-binding protein